MKINVNSIHLFIDGKRVNDIYIEISLRITFAQTNFFPSTIVVTFLIIL